jgi:hypothetical protein
MVFDNGGDATVFGSAARLGVSLYSIVDATAGIEHWPDMGTYKGWSVQGEASFHLLGRRAVSPYLLIGAGYFRANHSVSTYPDVGGFTHAVALGVMATAPSGLGVRVEAVSRVDAGSPDPQLRGFATFSPRTGTKPLGAPEARLTIGGMIPIGGPWRLTEPQLAAKFATPILSTQGVGVSVMLVHWQIRDSTTAGGYLWDTRSGIIGLGWWSRVLTGAVSLKAEAGPAMSLMWEGPDYYTRGGAHLDLDATLEAGPIPLTAGAGWLWLSRTSSQGRRATPGTDQHGLIFWAGIRL